MTNSNPARFKPALIALVAGTLVLATGCSSSGTSTQAAGGAAVSQLEAATGGSISGDCVSGSGQGASATVCADENGNASVKATVDDEASGASVNAATDDTAGASTDATTADDEGTDNSAAAGGSATTTKPAAATGKCGAGFPLPSGTVVVTCSDEAASVDLVATVPDPEGAYDFYLDALPKAGYTITDKESANLAGVYGATITFTGGDFTGADTSVVLTDLGTGGLTVHLAR